MPLLLAYQATIPSEWELALAISYWCVLAAYPCYSSRLLNHDTARSPKLALDNERSCKPEKTLLKWSIHMQTVAQTQSEVLASVPRRSF